jgi:hypothetical protein
MTCVMGIKRLAPILGVLIAFCSLTSPAYGQTMSFSVYLSWSISSDVTTVLWGCRHAG